MADLAERLLNPETVEAAIPALVQGIYQNIRANLAVPEVKAAVDAIRELHHRLAAAKAELTAETRRYEAARDLWAGAEFELATAKAEGAAEAYEAEAAYWEEMRERALSMADLSSSYQFRRRRDEAIERAAALRKQVQR